MARPSKGYTNVPAAGNPARTEAWALLESARAMEDGRAKGREELLQAVRRNWRLWTIFQASLSAADCQMPLEPRRNLLMLANVVDRETVAILADPNSSTVDTLVNISRQIGEGLMEGARAAAKSNPTASVAGDQQGLRESA